MKTHQCLIVGIALSLLLLVPSFFMGNELRKDHVNMIRYQAEAKEQVVGNVTSIEGTQKFCIGGRSILAIEIPATGEIVRAVLHTDGAYGFPEKVSFLYSGDPSQEVYLFEETPSIWFAWFFMFGPALMIILCYVFFKRTGCRIYCESSSD